MSVTGAARGTSQRRLFYRCGASIYRGRGRLGAVRSVCRTAGLGVGRAIVCSHPGRVLLQVGWRVRLWEHRLGAKRRQTNTPSPYHSHPGRVLLQDGGTRSIVGAPPRCEAKANQYTEPVPFAPGAGAPTGWGDAFDCRSTASVRTESNQYTEPALFAPGAGAPTCYL